MISEVPLIATIPIAKTLFLPRGGLFFVEANVSRTRTLTSQTFPKIKSSCFLLPRKAPVYGSISYNGNP